MLTIISTFCNLSTINVENKVAYYLCGNEFGEYNIWFMCVFQLQVINNVMNKAVLIEVAL